MPQLSGSVFSCSCDQYDFTELQLYKQLGDHCGAPARFSPVAVMHADSVSAVGHGACNAMLWLGDGHSYRQSAICHGCQSAACHALRFLADNELLQIHALRQITAAASFS